jgi:hypothetical protein
MAAIIEGNKNLTEGVYFMKERIRFERNVSMCVYHMCSSLNLGTLQMAKIWQHKITEVLEKKGPVPAQ